MGSLVAVAALLLASALFVAAEFALVAARRSSIESTAVTSSRARTTLKAIDDLSVMMACAQLGITACGLVLGAVGEPAVAQLLAPALDLLPEGIRGTASLVTALGLVAVAHVVLGEMLPKNIALASPERAAILLAPGLRAVAITLGPLVRGLDRAANLVIRAIGVTPVSAVAEVVTGDQLRSMVRESAAAGLIDVDDSELVGSALEFTTARIGELAVADDHLVTVPAPVRTADVERACGESGFSRFPVRASGGHPHRYVGYVHIRDALQVAAEHLGASRIRPMPVLRADELLGTALRTMQLSRAHLCRVIDDDGPVGVVWLEDIIEVLVGTIADGAGGKSGAGR